MRVERMSFVDRHILGGAVDLAGRGVHDPRDPEVGGRLNHVKRAGDVGVDVAFRGEIRIGNADQSRQMQHCVAARNSLPDGMGIANITSDNFDPIESFGGGVVEPARGTPGIILNESAGFGAIGGGLLNQMGANKTAGTSNKNLGRIASHAVGPRCDRTCAMVCEYG